MDKLCSEDRHVEIQTQCVDMHARLHTGSELQVRVCECVRSGAQEGGRTYKLNKQRSVTVVEGEPPSNEKNKRERGIGWERDEGLVVELYNLEICHLERITWVGKGRKAGD